MTGLRRSSKKTKKKHEQKTGVLAAINKTREVVQALNKYAVQLYGEKNEHEFSLKVVSNKIDNLKSKVRDFYKKYTASTQTSCR